MSVALINSSTCISDLAGQLMVSAVNRILPIFCKDWGLAPHSVTYFPKGVTTNIPLKVFILDSSYSSDQLGSHGVSYTSPHGKCFAKSILANGGAVLYSSENMTPTVSQCVSHQIFELIIDPFSNMWLDSGDDKLLYAKEVCDPVEGNIVAVTVSQPASKVPVFPRLKKNQEVFHTVSLCDWILPAWTDRDNIEGPYNHTETLARPFSIDKFGYAIVMKYGPEGRSTSMKFGEQVTEEDEKKYSCNSRIIKRKI